MASQVVPVTYHKRAWRIRSRRTVMVSGQILVFLVAVGIWDVAATHWVESFLLSRPILVLAELGEWAATGFVLPHLAATFGEMALGVLLGSAVGIGLAVLFRLSPFIAEVFEPFVMATYSLPRIAFIPLLIVWFGAGMTSTVVFTAMAVFLMMFASAAAGMRDVDPDMMNAIRLMGARQSDLLRWVVLPQAMTFIFSGLMLAVPFALVSALAAELMTGSVGLGYLLSYGLGFFDAPMIYATTILLAVLGTVINLVLIVFANRALAWKIRPESRARQRR